MEFTPDASVEDWQALLDLVGERGWKCQYSEGEGGAAGAEGGDGTLPPGRRRVP